MFIRIGLYAIDGPCGLTKNERNSWTLDVRIKCRLTGILRSRHVSLSVSLSFSIILSGNRYCRVPSRFLRSTFFSLRLLFSPSDVSSSSIPASKAFSLDCREESRSFDDSWLTCCDWINGREKTSKIERSVKIDSVIFSNRFQNISYRGLFSKIQERIYFASPTFPSSSLAIDISRQIHARKNVECLNFHRPGFHVTAAGFRHKSWIEFTLSTDLWNLSSWILIQLIFFRKEGNSNWWH